MDKLKKKKETKELLSYALVITAAIFFFINFLKIYVWLGKWYYKPLGINLDGKSSYLKLFSKLLISILISYPLLHLHSYNTNNFFNLELNEILKIVVMVGFYISIYVSMYFILSLILKLKNKLENW
jgi:hypothetical protein|tara:strand:- start:274 stop:651 length:378 start_codon:yes stop_codon:yes gene_type:complete